MSWRFPTRVSRSAALELALLGRLNPVKWSQLGASELGTGRGDISRAGSLVSVTARLASSALAVSALAASARSAGGSTAGTLAASPSPAAARVAKGEASGPCAAGGPRSSCIRHSRSCHFDRPRSALHHQRGTADADQHSY